MKNTAIAYLSKDIIKHVGMIECIKHDDIDFIYSSVDGVFFYDKTANLYMLSTDNKDVCARALSKTQSLRLLVCHSEVDYLYAREKFGLFGCNKCHQALWLKKQTLPLKGICRIEKLLPTEQNINFVCEHYTLAFDKAHIEFIMNEIGLYGAYLGDILVGFIGRHEERSMGLLEVLPEYRRKGIGEELEKFLINMLVENDEIPYGHIIYGNDKSVNMQKKLGFTFAENPVYWIFKAKA